MKIAQKQKSGMKQQHNVPIWNRQIDVNVHGNLLAVFIKISWIEVWILKNTWFDQMIWK